MRQYISYKPSADERAVYTVEDICKLLGICDKKAYELIKSNRFPSIRLRRRILIPKEPFYRWLNQEVAETNTINS